MSRPIVLIDLVSSSSSSADESSDAESLPLAGVAADDDDDEPESSSHDLETHDDEDGLLADADYTDPAASAADVAAWGKTVKDPRALPFFLHSRFADPKARAAMFKQLAAELPSLFMGFSSKFVQRAAEGGWDTLTAVYVNGPANFDAFFSDSLYHHRGEQASHYLGMRRGLRSPWMKGLALGNLRVEIAPYEGRLMRSVFFGRLLNALTTAYPFVVTPHFATFLGSVLVDTVAKRVPFVDTEEHELAILWDTGNTPFVSPHDDTDWTLVSVLRQLDASDDRHIRSMIFQFVFSLNAAAAALGVHYRVTDLNHINVAVERDARRTEAYVQRIWSYKFAGKDEWINLVPSVHVNMFITIREFNATVVGSTEPGSAANRAAFFDSVQRFFALLMPLLVQLNRGNGRLSTLIGDIAQWQIYVETLTGDAKVQMMDTFYDKWFSKKGMFGLGYLFTCFDDAFTDMTHTRADDDDNPWFANKMYYLMGVIPADNIAVTEHELAAPLGALWNLKQGMKRTDYGCCRACGAPPRFSTLDDEHHFCSESCADVMRASVKHQ